MIYDIAVIGDGIIGLSIAYQLSKESSLKIAVIGKNSYNNSASLAAGAMLNCFAEITRDSFKNQYTKSKFDLSFNALDMWPDWLDELNSQVDSSKKVRIDNETFVVLNSKSGKLDSDNFDTMTTALKEYKQPWQFVDYRDIEGFDPSEESRPLRSIRLDKEGSIESGKFINLLKQVLESKQNVTFVNQIVNDINCNFYGINSVNLDNGEKVSADKFIFAAGVYTQNLLDKLPQINERIPRVLSGTGYAAVIDQSYENKIKSVIRTPNRSGACGLHVVPNGENLYIGATNNVCFTPTTQPKMGLLQFLMNCTIEQINYRLYNSNIIETRFGNRPVSVDTFPLIGKTSMDNLWVVTGTYRDGFHQSPFIAKNIANDVLGKEANIDPLFLPERDLIVSMKDIEDSIEETSQHYIAGLIEHSFKLPKLFPEESLRKLFVEKFRRVYDELGISYPLSPDILFMFELDGQKDDNMEYFKNYKFTRSLEVISNDNVA